MENSKINHFLCSDKVFWVYSNTECWRQTQRRQWGLSALRACSVLVCSVNQIHFQRIDLWPFVVSDSRQRKKCSKNKSRRGHGERESMETLLRQSWEKFPYLNHKLQVSHFTAVHQSLKATGAGLSQTCKPAALFFYFFFLSQVHVVQTPQGEDYEGRTFHGKRVSELHLQPAVALFFGFFSPPCF